MKKKLKSLINSPYTLLALLWLIMIFIVNPIGEFPLNDDWAYHRDVLNYLEKGKIEMVNWSAMTLITQIYMGVFWSKLFGFSFNTLRILTLLMGLIGIFTTYKLLWEWTKNEMLCFSITLIIACNPLYIAQSNSFMTDIYFFTFSVLSCYFFTQNLLKFSYKNLILATLFTLIATFVRQIGVIFPIAYFVITFFSVRKEDIIRKAGSAFIPVICSIIALFIFNRWMKSEQTTYVSFDSSFSMMGRNTIDRFFYRIGHAGLLMGFIFMPLLMLQLPLFLKKTFWQQQYKIILITLIFIIPLIKAWNSFPVGNVFYNFGIGPRLLKDVEILKINNEWLLDKLIINTIRCISIICGLIIYYNIILFISKIREIYNETETQIKGFYFLILAGLFLTFIIPPFFFDRYLIQILLPLSLLLVPNLKNYVINGAKKYWFYGIIGIYFCVTTLLTHDYFAWNRAKWEAIHYLMHDKNIPPNEIDGGFEFNAWYLLNAKSENTDTQKSWWFVDKDNYMISFGKMPNYDIINHFSYTQFLPYQQKNIYISIKKMAE